MARLRVAATAACLWALWALSFEVVCATADHDVSWRVAMGAGVVLLGLHWMLAPLLLGALYRIEWLTTASHGDVVAVCPAARRVGLVDVEDPWCMSFGRPGRGVLLVTKGLLELGPDVVHGALSREERLLRGADLGAASALAAPLIWCGVVDEYFLSSGRQVAPGLGGGVYLGLLARALHWGCALLSAATLRGRHGDADGPDDGPWLRELATALKGPAPTVERRLRRAYAARAAVLLPLDVAELSRLAVLDSNLDRACAAALGNPWEQHTGRWHPPLGRRLGITPQGPQKLAEASYRSHARSAWCVGVLVAVGVLDVVFRHWDVGMPVMALGFGLLLALRARYPSGLAMQTLPLQRPLADETPWFPEPLLVDGAKLLPVVWPAAFRWSIAPVHPLWNCAGVGHDVTGWVRHERVPYLEVLEAHVDGRLRVNHAVLLRTLSTGALVMLGALLNLAAISW